MKIVILDGFTLNPGDLDDRALQSLGEVISHDRTRVESIPARARGAQILLTNKTPLGRETLARLPELSYIGVLATGTNVVDMAAASEQGICVTNVPGYGPDAVAQMVFAHILHHSQSLALHDSAVKAGAWSRSADFCFTLAPLQSLKGKTLGLIGYGAIGQRVASIALAFGMRVLVHSRSLGGEPSGKRQALPEGIAWAPFESLLAQADILSLHCPLTRETDKLINAGTLALMKPGALLINTARGGLIDEAALAAALNAGRLRAGVDVLSTEPPAADNPLLSAANISISPHIAWATREARQNLLDIAVANIQAFLAGKGINRVN
ncbi:D-2-hydroxyacid dehydrogenase [Shewanella sp. AS16]|uniref:D-2-hydroxyacid dehydrogenase n=1 Tax=Shewanella sp. AS16 TaxID=2907625 RepID=UPI001F3D7D65|nr:D-2-hydroxyacid dehydrogenase [Shewanella sp. AS16]MCE9685406.1 D-2-hydroxyacid dehydrogenase [Shewanella sp. AS16]